MRTLCMYASSERRKRFDRRKKSLQTQKLLVGCWFLYVRLPTIMYETVFCVYFWTKENKWIKVSFTFHFTYGRKFIFNTIIIVFGASKRRFQMRHTHTHTDTRCDNSKSIRKLYVSCCSRASRSHFIMCAFVCIPTSLILSNSFGVDETQRNTQNNSNNNSNDNDNERRKKNPQASCLISSWRVDLVSCSLVEALSV